MTIESTIQEIAKRLVDGFDPRRVILFGSYARGDATEHSDFDFIVLVDDATDRLGLAARMHQAMRGIPFGCDFVVATKDEYEIEKQIPGSVFYYADEEKQVLYDRAA